MVKKDLLTKLRAHKGEVLVAVMNVHDVYYVRAVKADLIDMVQTRFVDDAETGFSLDDEGYFDKDTQVQW